MDNAIAQKLHIPSCILYVHIGKNAVALIRPIDFNILAKVAESKVQLFQDSVPLKYDLKSCHLSGFDPPPK